MSVYRNELTERALDAELGERLHHELTSAYAKESEAWATDRMQRVAQQLQSERAAANRFIPEILWVDQMTAFAAPGRYLYITRELLQRLTTDDSAAFVLAHEIAHHDLGHLALFRGKRSLLRSLPGSSALAAALLLAEHLLFSPEHETEADEYALQLCLEAGYSGPKCMEVFDVLQAHCLDLGDVDMAYGLDEAMLKADELDRDWLAGAKLWSWRKMRGYPSLRERKENLLAQMP